MLSTKGFVGNNLVVPTKSQCLWLHYTAVDQGNFNLVSVDLCALELGQKTYKTTKIKHYYQCIAWEQVEPIPNQH